MKLFALLIGIAALLPGIRPAAAEERTYDNVIEAQIRPGWRLPDGSHIAGLELRLAPEWKTYWRAPGDSGLPPVFEWQGQGVQSVSVKWPTPEVFRLGGMRSIGYHDHVVLPLHVQVDGTGAALLSAEIELGICKDVCLPHHLSLSVALPSDDATRPDPLIAAALASLPLDGEDVGMGEMSCTLSALAEGLYLRTEIPMARPTGPVESVIETADPEIWVAEPRTRWTNGLLVSETRMLSMSGMIALDRSKLRQTLLRPGQAVEFEGCVAG